MRLVSEASSDTRPLPPPSNVIPFDLLILSFHLIHNLPSPVLSRHIHLGGVPVPWRAAGICVIHKLLV